MKLEDWLQLWVILPSNPERNSLSLDCSFTRDEGHAWLAREMVLSEASKSSTISASWEMGPRVNGKAVRGRSHPFSSLPGGFPQQLLPSWQGMAEAPWGFQANSVQLGGVEGPSLEAWCPKRKVLKAYKWQEVGMSVMDFVWPADYRTVGSIGTQQL